MLSRSFAVPLNRELLPLQAVLEERGGQAKAKQHSRALQEKDFARLTFGENVRLIERPDIWSRLKNLCGQSRVHETIKRHYRNSE